MIGSRKTVTAHRLRASPYLDRSCNRVLTLGGLVAGPMRGGRLHPFSAWTPSPFILNHLRASSPRSRSSGLRRAYALRAVALPERKGTPMNPTTRTSRRSRRRGAPSVDSARVNISAHHPGFPRRTAALSSRGLRRAARHAHHVSAGISAAAASPATSTSVSVVSSRQISGALLATAAGLDTSLDEILAISVNDIWAAGSFN